MQAQNFEIPDNRRLRDWLSNPFWESVKINRYWFPVSIFISVSFALLFLRYKTPQYLVKASLLVRDDSKGSDFQEAALLESLGLPAAASSVENETEILKSRTLLAQVIDDLHLNHQYFAEGDIKTGELYEKAPFNIRFIGRSQTRPARYQLKFKSDGAFSIQWPASQLEGSFGDTLALPNGLAVVSSTAFQPSTDCGYAFVILRKEDMLDEYARALTVTPANKIASMVNLSIKNVLPAKGEAFLNRLIFDYQKSSVEDKNKIADNTIAFINSNLDKVSSELAQIETELERFRKQHGIFDVHEDNRQLSEAFSRYTAEEKTFNVRLKVIQALEEHLTHHPESVIPSSLYQQEPGFTNLAVKYNELQVLLATQSQTLSKQNPAVQSTEKQTITLRASLINAIRYQKEELRISIQSIHQYLREFKTIRVQIPTHERQLLGRSREQGIQQELYLFLLKKRMETAISRSSHIPVARIVDPPKASPKPITPDRQLTMLVSVLLGMACPLAVLYIKQATSSRITSKEEILETCSVRIIGEISQQSKQWVQCRKINNKHLLAEQFRTLRTNVQFLPESERYKVILVTSAMAGEGKSFVAAHLTHSFGLAGKKVILIDFDLRKPSLADNLGLENDGLTDFLSTNCPLNIQQNSIAHPFDFLASGNHADNPAELLHSGRISEIIHELRTRYDYILIDTPPIGLVSDARILGKHADLSLYIVRPHFTFRHQLADIQRIAGQQQLPDIQLVLNGSKHIRTYQYSYYTTKFN